MITCPRCGMTSHNPDDERTGYCGNCHDWTSAGAPDPLDSFAILPEVDDRYQADAEGYEVNDGD